MALHPPNPNVVLNKAKIILHTISIELIKQTCHLNNKHVKGKRPKSIGQLLYLFKLTILTQGNLFIYF